MNIKYCEVESDIEELIDEAFALANSGESVGLTTSPKYFNFLLQIISKRDFVGVDDHIPIGKGKLYLFQDDAKNMKKITVLICDKYSNIGRTSLAKLKVKMIKHVK